MLRQDLQKRPHLHGVRCHGTGRSKADRARIEGLRVSLACHQSVKQPVVARTQEPMGEDGETMVGRAAGVTRGWALPASARPAPAPQRPPPPRPIWVDEVSQNRQVPRPRKLGKRCTHLFQKLVRSGPWDSPGISYPVTSPSGNISVSAEVGAATGRVHLAQGALDRTMAMIIIFTGATD